MSAPFVSRVQYCAKKNRKIGDGLSLVGE